MQSHRLKLALPLAIFVALLVFAACSAPAAPPVVQTVVVEKVQTGAPVVQTQVVEKIQTSAPVVQTVVVQATAAPAQAPEAFVFGAQGEPVCLDPAVITDGISGRIINQVYEGLVKFDKDTTNPVPALAKSWTTSDDGKEWTFKLQEGVKFHDGTDFNADAVVKNFDYWGNTKNPQHDAQIKAGQTFEYYEAQFGGFDENSIIEKVEAVDPTTVKFTLRQPQGPFLNNLAMFVFVFASPTALEKYGVDTCKNPVGTGPYKFVEWKPNEQVTLDANADYWDKANAPKMNRVIVRNIPNNSARLLALAAGEINALEGMEPRDVAAIKDDPRFKLLLRPTNTTGYLAFNYNVKEFNDPKVRQAFAQAINKKAIVDALYGGTGLVAKELQPPSLWGYNPNITDWAYDTEAAKKLLADAGFANGLSEVTLNGKKVPLELWYMPVSRPYYPNPKDIGTAMAADLAKAGINVSLQTVDWATYLDRRAKGELPLYMLGWTGDNGDPDNFVCYFFCMSADDKPLSREGFVNDKELSDLLKKAASTIDKAERTKMYQESEQMLHDKILRVFIANNQPPLALGANVEGYIPNPTGTEYFNTVQVKAAQ
ncbi:MAG: ABC transporter substrate-binding protein [Chloroflexota bacterium]|nr:MAG: ABC transporter substrate-binding protein [Chloroflexota bacterium]